MQRYIVLVKRHAIAGEEISSYAGDYSNLDSAFYEIYKMQRNYRIMNQQLNYVIYDRKTHKNITKEDYEKEKTNSEQRWQASM